MLPAVPPKTPKKTPAAAGGEQLNIRATTELLRKLDGWVEHLNRGRRLPLTRTDVVRGVLDWAAEHRPDFEDVGAVEAPQAARSVRAKPPATVGAGDASPNLQAAVKFMQEQGRPVSDDVLDLVRGLGTTDRDYSVAAWLLILGEAMQAPPPADR